MLRGFLTRRPTHERGRARGGHPVLHQHPKLWRLRRCRSRREGGVGGGSCGVGCAISLGPRRPRQALSAELWRSLDAPHGRGAGNVADQVRPDGHPGRTAATAAARTPGVDRVRDVILLPRPVQRPRVPVWIGGFWPHRAPMRRAARWDGAVPLFLSAGHGHPPPVDEVRDLVACVGAHRHGDPARPFEFVLGGASPTVAAEARDLLGPLIEAGATWWDERRGHDDEIEQLEPVLRRIDAGPPTI
jgi:hypothetical protein